MAYSLAFDIFARDRASAQFDKLGRKVKGTQQQMSTSSKAMGLAASAAGLAVLKFGHDSVEAYVDAEKSQRVLTDAYRRFPALADVPLQSLRDQAKALEQVTQFDDDATAAAMGQLAAYKLTGAQVQQLTPLLLDYAQKTGKDLPTAAGDLGKALLGQGRALKTVGINFKDTGTTAGNFAELVGGLRTQVGGFATSEGKAAEGQAAILRNRFGDLQEVVGSKLVPALTSMTSAGLATLGWMDQNQGKTRAIVAATGALVAILIAAKVAALLHAGAMGVHSAAMATNTAVVALSRSTFATWLGVKALELGAWVGSTAATVAATAATLGNAIASKAAAVATVVWSGVLKAAAAAQWVLNVALSANPIGLVIVAIAALAAGLIYAYKHSEKFRAIVTGALHMAGAAAIWLWNNAFAPAIRFIVTGFANIVTAIGWMLRALGHIPGFGWAKTAADKMFGAARAALNLASNIRNIPTSKSVAIRVNTYYVTHGSPAPGTSTSSYGGKGYASGTPSAPRGWAWVGEKGPELMHLKGGEQIIPAGESAAIASARSTVGMGVGVTNNYITITGPTIGTPSTVAQQIQQALNKLQREA